MSYKIQDKPKYCHAWTSNTSDEPRCNTIPCCGFCLHGSTKRASQAFYDIDKIGANQGPYYNDSRKVRALLEDKYYICDMINSPTKKVYLATIEDREGNLYPAVKISERWVESYLKELETVLGENYSPYTENQQERDRNSYHMTFLSVPEYGKIMKEGAKIPFAQEFEITFKGIGTVSSGDKQAWYIVIEAPQLNEYRKTYKLSPKDFHVTLAFKNTDVFGVRKDFTTLI